MPRILVTNDDGISSKGLSNLAEALARVGDVVIVAPSTEQSASAHSLTLTRPLRVRKHGNDEYTVDGTPTDCVTRAMTKILEGRLPNIGVSGINYGPNLGDDVTYSGTVAGALEASVFGLPGIAFSLATRSHFDFSYAAAFAADLVLNVIETGLPEGTILNVNVPPGPTMGARLTHQGIKVAQSEIVEGLDPRGRPYYWIGEQTISWKEDEGSDHAAVAKGLVSITPLRTDMTDYRALETLRSGKLNLNG